MSLPLRVRAAYAVPGFAFALIGIPVYVHLPKFYGDTLGVDLAFIGLVIFASRVWDAVTDPAIGFLSDRTRTRFGRRRPYLVVAALPLGLSTMLLLAPPGQWPADRLLWWFALLLPVMFLAWTSVQIPHAALGPELTADPHERTRLFAGRDGLWILGTLVAAASPAIARAALGLAPGPGSDRAVFRTLAWVYGPMLVLLPWLCAAVVREPAHPERQTETPWRGTLEALGNRPFRMLLIAYGVGALGAALPATLILFYVEHVLRAPQLAEGFLALYFVSGFVCLPLWTWLAPRIGRKRAWLSAMAVNVGAFVFAFFLGPGDTLGYGLVCVCSGVGFGAGLVLPNSLVADTIDYDEWRSGRRREGLYFGLWSIVTKVSAATGAAAALPLLKWAGYVPQAEQTEPVLWMLRLLYALVPCLCYAAGFAIAIRFPISDAIHHRIRAAVAARHAGEQAADPLMPLGAHAR